MACLQYFLPRATAEQLTAGGKINRQLLTERGLAGILSDITKPGELSTFDIATAGPGGVSGVVVVALPGHGEPPRRIGYHPTDEHLAWSPVGEGDSLWICVDRTFPPTPSDLVRRKTIEGHPVTLDDGNAWIVPVIRRWPSGTRLPRSFGFGADGKLVEKLKAGFEPYWERSATVSEFVYGSGSLELQWIIETSIDALALNYRIGRNEQTILGLVDSSNWRKVLEAMVDLPFAVEVLEEEDRKKKAASLNALPGPPSSEAGSAA